MEGDVRAPSAQFDDEARDWPARPHLIQADPAELCAPIPSAVALVHVEFIGAEQGTTMEGFPRNVVLAVLAVALFATPGLRGQVRLPAVSANPAPASPAPSAQPASPQPPSAPAQADSQFECGEPHKVIDSIGWVFGIPRKIILWDRRAMNHDVSPDTERSLNEYLNDNAMTITKVRINEYDPGGEWRRLVANKKVGAGWRYTFGAVGTVGYTLFPGRLFGADGYNPDTDSIYIYSDIPSVVREQAAYAKLVKQRSYPGTYVAITSLPFVRLWPEKQSKDDVLDYTIAHGTPQEQREAIHAMYPEYGAEVADELTQFVPGGFLLTAAGAGLGHAAAQFDASAPVTAQSAAPVAAAPAAETAKSEAVVPASFNR